MKLLLDENLSRRLLPPLSDTYPDSTHVALVGLERATDMAVWDFAAANGYTIVTKDDDFSALSALRGHPLRIKSRSASLIPRSRWPSWRPRASRQLAVPS